MPIPIKKFAVGQRNPAASMLVVADFCILNSLYYLRAMKVENKDYPAIGKIRRKIVAKVPFLSSTAEKKKVHVYQ